MSSRVILFCERTPEWGGLTDWKETDEALKRLDSRIVTTQMGFLSMHEMLRNYGYRIFIKEDQGEAYEICLGDNERTSREIRKEHNLFKMWLSGEFSNGRRKANG